jgi:predicted dehydrogenase
MEFDIAMPLQPKPVYIIGAGGIVKDAHLPAYQIAGFPVEGIFDIEYDKAASLALKYKIPMVFKSIGEMVANAKEGLIFDVAVPGNAIEGILMQLPERSAVMMQKPMGNDLEEAKKILQLTKDRKLLAGVNFQLRFAPFINTARRMIEQGQLGELCGIEVNINVYTPWHLWHFLYDLPRVEILYHSIHYIDLIRSFLGNPYSVYAKTVKHPLMGELASVKSNIIMDYGNLISANILTNHCHIYGSQHQHSFIKFEGTKGAIKIKLGLLMDYPTGVPDEFEYVILERGKEPEWKKIAIAGGWFPHAFIGSMSQMMMAMEGTILHPANSVEDAIHTMACVEAAYRSDAEGGIKLL